MSQTHEIVLLLGDNLSDFHQLFERKTQDQRDASVQQLRAEFGKRFIVLPNMSYGGWEDAAYGNQRLTPLQKDSAIRKSIHAY